MISENIKHLKAIVERSFCWLYLAEVCAKLIKLIIELVCAFADYDRFAA